MKTTTLFLAMAGMILLPLGCGNSGTGKPAASPEDEQTTSDAGKHDTKPTYSSYQPETADGLTSLGITPVKVGKGPVVTEGCTIAAYYKGMLMDGTVFEESDRRNSPVTLLIESPGGVIEGWARGLVGQREGAVVKLAIPAAMAYGKEGSPPKIPPDADLQFEIEVVKVYQ